MLLAVQDKKQSTVSHLDILGAKQFPWYAADFILSMCYVLLPITDFSISKFGTRKLSAGK